MWKSSATPVEPPTHSVRQHYAAKPTVELSVIMPCYNESDGIEMVLREWSNALEKSVDSFEILVINDGSTDGTGRILDRLRKELKGVRVVHQLNVGHASSIRRGYELARGHHVLQVDSNGRYEVSDFGRMWEQRDRHAMVLAYRTHCLDSLFRRSLNGLIGFGSRVLFNVKLRDPNVPFRIIRREITQLYLRKIPSSSEAINLSLALLISRDFPDSICQIAVPFRARPKGTRHCSTLAFLTLWLQIAGDLFRLRITTLTFQLPKTAPISLART